MILESGEVFPDTVGELRAWLGQFGDGTPIAPNVDGSGRVYVGASYNVDDFPLAVDYTLQTHWLGDDPDGAWVLDKSTLNSTTVAYVDSLSGGAEWSRAGVGVV